MASGMQMLAGGFLLLLLAVVTGDPMRLNLANASWTSIGAFFYLLVFGSLVGFTAYSWLLNNVAPARAATYAYVNPVVAVFLGWMIASEPLTKQMLTAAAGNHRLGDPDHNLRTRTHPHHRPRPPRLRMPHTPVRVTP